MRIATLNTQNLRLQIIDGQKRLHGAWDSDDPEDQRLDPIDRRLTAELLRRVDADVVALQEVFDRETLDYFHDSILVRSGAGPYPYRVCLPGNDGRGLDVAVMSRCPIEEVQSHAALRLADIGLEAPPGVNPELPIFRRDCLMVVVAGLAMFVCHFKSAYPDESKSWVTRRLEALATRRIIERRFPNPERAMWLVLGDLNEPDDPARDGERATAPLEAGFSIDLLQRLPEADRWTYFDPHSGLYHGPDVMLASQALADRWSAARPGIVRCGLGRETSRFTGPRLGSVGRHRPHASDHAAIFIDLPDL